MNEQYKIKTYKLMEEQQTLQPPKNFTRLTKMIAIQKLEDVLPFILLLFLLYKLKCHLTHNNKKISLLLPPTPPKLPILGNLHQLGTHPHRSLQSLAKRYGDLMWVYLGNNPALIVSSARAAEEIMKSHDVMFSNRPTSRTCEKLLHGCKDVGASPYGEPWRHRKSICVLQLLNNKRVRSFGIVRRQEMALMMGKIVESGSSPVNLSHMFKDFTTEIICRVVFGRKFGEIQDESGVNFKRIVEDFVEFVFTFQVGDCIPWLTWVNRFDGWDKKVKNVARELHQFLENVVQQHQDRFDSQDKKDEDDNGVKLTSFVDVLLDLQKHEKSSFPIDRDTIKGLILDMFSGGTDTTSAGLEWAMTEILRNPQVMRKLQKEVRGIVGDKYEVDEEDLEQMTYLKAVIKETFRLHPPAPLSIPRQSTQNVKIKGYDIPAGATVITNVWAIHMDPAYWDEPETFNPDRFLDSTIDLRGQHFQFMPFGAGRRMCPGISFATANNEVVLANLINRFDWTLPGEHLDMSEGTGLALHRKTPLLAIATARK